LPESSSDAGVPGTLRLSDEEFRLELEGTLLIDSALRERVSDYFAPVPLERVHGESGDRRAVTLESCEFAGSSNDHESYWPRIVCVGAWFSADEPLAFDKVFVRLSSLQAWSAVSGFEPKWAMIPPGEGESITQTFTRPLDHRAELGDGTIIKLSFPLRERTEGLYTFEKTFTQATRLVFEFPEPRELEHVQRLVFTLRNFLTLAVGEAVRVTELVGYRKPLPTEQLPIGREAEILYQHLENPHARELPSHHHMVFLLPDIAERFEHHMVQWFDHAAELGRVLDLYFATLHVAFVYLETRFMNFAQAIEGYHRRRLNRLAYPEETFEAYEAAILEHLSGRPRRLAKKALKYANEVKLEDRIRDVLTLLSEAGWSVLVAGRITAEDFARRAAQIRNIYAHNLVGEEPEHLELVVLTYQLKTLVEALFLHEIGFEDRAIDTMLRDARRYQLISSMRARW
jgi:hypothetical protein